MVEGRNSTACSTRAAGGPYTRRRSRCALLAARDSRYVAFKCAAERAPRKPSQWL